MNKPEPPKGNWVWIPDAQQERAPRRPFPAIPLFIGLCLVFQAFVGWGALGALHRLINRYTAEIQATEQQQP